MEEWNKEFAGQAFITDLGGEQQVEMGEEVMEMGRFAVWVPQGDGHQIVEVGGDLPALRKKYGIPEERVCVLVRREAA